jgi:5'-nucleotidase
MSFRRLNIANLVKMKVGLIVPVMWLAFLIWLSPAFSVTLMAVEHDLVIYHTNDVHGYAFEAKDEKGNLTRLGYDRLKAVVDSDETPHKLLLDAGDVIHGQSFATARRGELSAIVLSLVGYDALAVGNHDFDYGEGRLRYLTDKYRLRFLAANITETNLSGVEHFILPPYLIRSWGDMKIGIFGLSTPETSTTTDPRNVAGLIFSDPSAAARAMVKKLKEEEGADLIIALTHMGSEPYCQPMSQTIAAEAPGIDLIIDGHSHSSLSQLVTGAEGFETLVVSTGSYFANLGRIYADRKPEGGFRLSAEILPAASFSQVEPDQALTMAMGTLKQELEEELNQVVMTIPFDLDGLRDRVRSQSTNLGRIIGASLIKATGADVALLNGGSIRDSISSGEVTKGEILTVLPYGNYIYVLEISGADLLTALNHGLGQPGSGSFPQFWGLTVETESSTLTGTDGTKKEGLKAKSVQINGKPLDPNATYQLATNDFLHSGGDGYEIFTKYDYHEFGTLEEAFKSFMTESDPSLLREISETENLLTVK